MNEYRFSNLGLSGRVVLQEDSVHWSCNYLWHGRYERVIPLSKLQVDYMRTIGPPNNLGLLLGTTLIGLMVACSLLFDRFSHMASAVVAGLISVFAIMGLMLFLKYRKEEWLYFYGAEPHSSFCYCRRGQDSQHFDAFTAAVIEAIRGATPNRMTLNKD